MSWKRCGAWKVCARNGRETSAQHTEANLCRGSSVETVRGHRSNDAIRGCHKKNHRDVSMCVLHLHDKRCSLGIHESLLMIVTSFALRSPCSWQLQCECEMYVLQFYLNLFSVVLTQLRSTLRCRCIHASTSAPPHLSTFSSSHAHIRRSTSPPHHTHTSAHLYHICTSTLSLLHICPVFLSFYIFSLSSTSSRAHIHRSTLYTSIHLHILYRTCASTLSLLHVHPFFLSFYISFRQRWTITRLALGPPVV